MKIVIKGRIPSKKNSKNIVYVHGKPLILPSKNHQKWHKDTTNQLIGAKKIPSNIPITFTLYAPDRRKGDLSNKFESVADILVDCGLMEDDNWFILDDIHLKFGGIDRENPRCEIKY